MAITIKDIAREAGCAVGTASRVLNNHPNVSAATREKVLAVAKKYHFTLNSNAKHLKQQAQSGVAIIVKGSQNLVFAPIVEKMQGEMLRKGFASFIYYIDEMENEVEAAVKVCVERRPVGILFLGCNYPYFHERFAIIDIPCVLVTNSADDLNFPNLSSVSTDDTEASKAAVNYLLDLGHTNIGILGGYKEKSKVAKLRYNGCLEAFKKHNVPFDCEKQYVESIFSIRNGYNAMKVLLSKNPDVTAVFAISDYMAIGAMRAIMECGKSVPGDISVMGLDGLELGEFLNPKLTTIKQNGEQIAKRSIDILLANIDEMQQAVHDTVPFEIIVGESTKQL